MKRHEALVQLRRDHHFGLLLCWKLKEGMKKDVKTKRMADYILEVFEQNLKPHFAEEEEFVFPILGDDDLIKEAINEHRKLERMIQNGFTDYDEVAKFRNLLEKHIRTEEREIFEKIQEVATDEQLDFVLKQDFSSLKDPIWEDDFWK